MHQPDEIAATSGISWKIQMHSQKKQAGFNKISLSAFHRERYDFATTSKKHRKAFRSIFKTAMIFTYCMYCNNRQL